LIRLRSFVFNIYFFAWTALVLILFLPGLAFPRRGVNALARIWIRGTFAGLALICGLRHRLTGLENLPAKGPFILAAKHQSAWDTLALAYYLPAPVFILKRELLWIPLFGWYLRRAGNIAVDRSKGATALRSLLHQAKERAEEGHSLIIFPEGTRVAPGTDKPYQPGAVALYEKLELPVIPLALNSGLFWGRRSFLKKPGLITARVLPAIAPGLPRKDFQRRLKETIEAASRALAQEAAPETSSDPA
jgi:1-acyl-sn-glycerol-3-phosphate acyltransferase